MIYLVDYENVNLNGMVGIENLEEKDHVIVFLGNNTGAIPFEWHIRILDSKAQVKYIKCGKVCKNYLDFQLATFCGYIMAGLEHEKVYVVSKDKGFDSVVDFWTENKEDVEICRIEAIDESLGIPRPMNKNKNQRTKKNSGRTRGGRRNNGNRREEIVETAEVLTEVAEESVEEVAEDFTEEPVEIEVVKETVEGEPVAEAPAEAEPVVEENSEEEPVAEEISEEEFVQELTREEAAETAEEEPAEAEVTEEQVEVAEESVKEEQVAEEPAEAQEIMEKSAEAQEITEETNEAAAAQPEVTAEEIVTEEAAPAPASEPKRPKNLPESVKKRIRQKIKDEQLKGGSYKTIYNIFVTEKAKNRFNTALVKAFQQERGNRIYKKILPEFEEYRKSQA